MEQPAINQRINFLVAQLATSVRAFSTAIGESTTNTHKYTKGTTKPSADFLEKIVVRFREVNAHWLLTGEGDAFRSETEDPRGIYQRVKNNSGNVVGTNHGNLHQGQHIGKVGRDAIQNHGASAGEVAALQRELEQLRAQLADKNDLIASKDEIIQLLKSKP